MASRAPLPDRFVNRPFLVSAALRAGLGRSRLASPDLQAPFSGVRTSSQAKSDVRSLCSALKLRMSPEAFFSHVTAAQVMQFPLPRRLESTLPLHVGTPAPGRAMCAANIVGHSIRISAIELVVWSGLRVTSPARTWLDLAETLSLVELVVVGDYLGQWERPLVTLNDLRDAAERYSGRTGRARIRLAVPLLRTQSESPRETMLRLLIVFAGLPEPECNVNVYDSRGRFVGRGDLVYSECKLMMEYQGDQHRADRRQWQHDIRRKRKVEDLGWHVMEFTSDDLESPSDLVERIERHLRSRVWTGTRLHE